MNTHLFAAQATTQNADDRATAFRSVQGGNQMQSGEMLLVEAYAAIWILLFLMLFLFWRRQAGMNQRIDSLEQAIAEARKAQTKGAKTANSAKEGE